MMRSIAHVMAAKVTRYHHAIFPCFKASPWASVYPHARCVVCHDPAPIIREAIGTWQNARLFRCKKAGDPAWI